MGLEMVELAMEVEERFEVRLPEVGCYHMRTLGDLHEVLLEQLGARRRTECSKQATFYRLRGALGQVCGITPRELRPSTPVLPLLGTRGRRRTWRCVQAALGCQLPPLESRAGDGAALRWAVGGVGAFLAIALATGDLCTAAGAAVVALLPGTLLGYIVGVFWIPTLPPPLRTAGDVARAIVALNPGEYRTAVEAPPDDDPTWRELCDIVAEQFAVPRRSLSPETRFVEDLGC